MPDDPRKHTPAPLPAHASKHAPAERAAVLKAEAQAAADAQPAPHVALRYSGPAGSFVPGLPTEGTGPDKTLTAAEVAARFTRGQFHAVVKAGLYTRVEPEAKPDPLPEPKPTPVPAAPPAQKEAK